jgi:hypothetical protein
MLLTKQHWAGTATFDVHSPFERGDTFEIKSRFDLTSKMFGDGVRSLAVPTGPRILMRPIESFGVVQKENRLHDYLCRPANYSETIRLKLPDGKTLTNLPRGEAVTRTLGEYHSSYRMDGDVLVVSRHIIWRLPSLVCNRQTADELAAVSRAIRRDTASQLVLVDANRVAAPVGRDTAKAIAAPTSDAEPE